MKCGWFVGRKKKLMTIMAIMAGMKKVREKIKENGIILTHGGNLKKITKTRTRKLLCSPKVSRCDLTP